MHWRLIWKNTFRVVILAATTEDGSSIFGKGFKYCHSIDKRVRFADFTSFFLDLPRVVAQWPVHLPLVLEVGCLIPRSWRGKYFVSEHTFLSVFAGMTLNEYAVPQIWMSPVQGKSPPLQVEELW